MPKEKAKYHDSDNETLGGGCRGSGISGRSLGQWHLSSALGDDKALHIDLQAEVTASVHPEAAWSPTTA